ncbi:MAG: DUF2244 domain-containing protein [Halomonadaceae bacterium]|nr:MAG: DUF2244 domain-containing protein [Halomonadaceae bacterium]
MIEHLPQEEGTGLVLTPNRSLSWKGNLMIFGAAVLFFTVMISVMIVVGAWVIFPFAVLELTVLFFGLYLTSRKCQLQEVLYIIGDQLRLEKGRYTLENEWEMPRQYARVTLTAPRHPFTPPKLLLMYRDTEVPLGTFLNEEDTLTLIDLLESKGVRIDRHMRPDVDLIF